MQKKPNHPLDIFIGTQLRLRRKMLGLSQDTLAKRVGITFQQVQKYERGINSVSAWRLQQFATTMEVSVMYFYDQPIEAAEASLPKPISDESFRLLQDFNAITSARVRHGVATLVREMAKGTTYGL